VMPMLLAPVGGVLADRWGTRPLMIAGVGLVAGGVAEIASVVAPGVAYVALVPGMAAMGAGSALFFAPVAATVLGAVAPTEQGQASGVATAVRELGVLAGIGPALWWGAALAAAAVPVALALPRRSGVHRPGAVDREAEVIGAG